MPHNRLKKLGSGEIITEKEKKKKIKINTKKLFSFFQTLLLIKGRDDFCGLWLNHSVFCF
jgi:hypothetical protein